MSGTHSRHLDFLNASFQIEGSGQQITVVFREEYHGQNELLRCLDMGKMGDIIVMNQGLHYLGEGRINMTQEDLLNKYKAIQSRLLEALDRGIKLVWRETSAAHFNTSDGYITDHIKQQQEQGNVSCVSSSIIESASSKNASNGLLVPFMQTLNISILETWEASYLLPEYCLAGRGIDCVHFLQPSGMTSYLTETLLNYIAKN